MKKYTLSLFIFQFANFYSHSQDTFSICAVDTITGEAGSAGASCIDDSQIAGGVVIISDVHPGVGVIHTQAYWLAANQNYAKSLMNLGSLSPAQIRDSLVAHDVQNNSTIRQYGIVDFDSTGSPRSASFTGVNCMNYKNHITGPNYSIQGNILLGQQILDSMQANFLNTQGDLACKLMAALQGANVVGADTRCTNSGNSSLSSFIRVACPGDTSGVVLCLDIRVISTPFQGIDPIDSLQHLYDNWLLANDMTPPVEAPPFRIYPNPVKDQLFVEATVEPFGPVKIYVLDATGRLVYSADFDTNNGRTRISTSGLAPGFYSLLLSGREGMLQSIRFVKQ